MKKSLATLLFYASTLSCADCTTNIPEACTQAAIILDTLQSDFTTCCTKLDTKLTTINQLLDKPCDQVTQITKPGIISTAGIYCLMNDIVGQLTIQASNVTIDLNNHVVTNANAPAITASNQSNITISNGSVFGCTGSSYAVLFNSCANVKVADINFANNVLGLSIANSTEFNIERSFFTENSSTIINIDNSKIGHLCDLNIDNNNSGSNRVVSITNSSYISLTSNTISNNKSTSPGFLTIFESCSNCSINNCVFSKNTSFGILILSTCQNTSVSHNTFTENSNSLITLFCAGGNTNSITCCKLVNNRANEACRLGENINPEINTIVENCIFESTNNGTVGRGLFVWGAIGCLIKNNKSRGNKTIGFRELLGLNNVFESNLSMDNTGSNFDNIPSITFNPTTGIFSSTPLAQSNISI